MSAVPEFGLLRGGRYRNPDCGAARGAGGRRMITIPTGVRIMLATRPVDFRRGAHSLAALAAASLGQDPFDGALIVFRAKRADRVKILLWDGSGLVLVWKQLQHGAFRWPPIVDGVMKLTSVEYAALFDGQGRSSLSRLMGWPVAMRLMTSVR